MSYNPKDDPFSDYSETGDRAQTGDRSSQGTREYVISPGPTDFDRYAKAVTVSVTNGGRATITYLPMRNEDSITVTKEVGDGWISPCAIRAVTALEALDDETAVLTRVDD